MVYAWNMKGVKPSFTPHHKLTTLELPKGTVLEIELVYETTGEVSTEINLIMFVLQLSLAHYDHLPQNNWVLYGPLANIFLWERVIVG